MTAPEESLAERLARVEAENAALREQLAARERERDEAIKQQTATAGVLRIISRTPTNLQTVLDALVEGAARLCDADNVVLCGMEDGDLIRLAGYGPGLRAMPAGQRLAAPTGGSRYRASLRWNGAGAGAQPRILPDDGRRHHGRERARRRLHLHHSPACGRRRSSAGGLRERPGPSYTGSDAMTPAARNAVISSFS